MRWLALLLLACATPEEQCASAGGSCVLCCCRDGGQRIESVDCNPSHNPGGAVCCPK